MPAFNHDAPRSFQKTDSFYRQQSQPQFSLKSMVKVASGTPWIIVCTDSFEQSVMHFRDILGLPLISEGIPTTDKQFQKYAQFQLPDGVVIEVVEPIDSLKNIYRGTIYSITVEDVSCSRINMESNDVKFISPILDDGKGFGWTYYQLPSGQIFQIQGRVNNAVVAK